MRGVFITLEIVSVLIIIYYDCQCTDNQVVSVLIIIYSFIRLLILPLPGTFRGRQQIIVTQNTGFGVRTDLGK